MQWPGTQGGPTPSIACEGCGPRRRFFARRHKQNGASNPKTARSLSGLTSKAGGWMRRSAAQGRRALRRERDRLTPEQPRIPDVPTDSVQGLFHQRDSLVQQRRRDARPRQIFWSNGLLIGAKELRMIGFPVPTALLPQGQPSSATVCNSKPAGFLCSFTQESVRRDGVRLWLLDAAMTGAAKLKRSISRRRPKGDYQKGA